ncbi:sugar-binding transcriptional regulator [Breznakiella homolactica]|uniref:Sugar-binding domain-containing protein n=1 Tax=Breznakiella homolactica TaxID=2798577 RepID=A0A7T7XQN8_9SPIR|nr:sugar-binding domain-containing protein [Breznakiella homolactica]QQO10689.1 hypothetical protein JFL75_07185 [Breznakiella homolactica]
MKKTNDSSKLDQLVTVSMLKYKLGYSQAQISKMLGVSTMTVSRMLDAAIDQGIVKISVKTSIDDDEELSQEIKAKYKLRDALIVRTNPYEDVVTRLAKATAFYLDLSICRGDVLGVAAGRTLSQVMPYMTLPAIGRDKQHFEVVQLQGGYTSMGDRNPTISIINFANRFGIEGHLLQHPMYASSPEAAKVIHEHYMADMEKLWKKCTLLVSGVGIWGPHCFQREEKLLGEDDLNELKEAGALGDLFGRWFDTNGNYLDCCCNQRVVSIPPRIQKFIPRRILVSYGEEKLQAIDVVLAHGMMNIFISDEDTAKQLLRNP